MVIPNASNHINFAVVTMVLLVVIVRFNSVDEYLYFLTGGIFGGLLPDMDHRRGTISKIIPFYLLHKLFKRWTKIFRHGGITHTVLVNLIIFGWYWWTDNVVILGMAVGYASHIYIDHIDGNKLNMLWYPLGRRRK